MTKNSSINLYEQGIPAGTWNKYSSRNPIQKMLVNRFLAKLASTAASLQSSCTTAIDVGCGEGVTTDLFFRNGLTQIRGYDFSDKILAEAQNNFPQIPFFKKNIYELHPEEDRSDFVAACEVLEHLEKPEVALERLSAICQVGGVISVPNEPLFRSLNFCAGKYWSSLGNSPGHINHWSKIQIVSLISKYFRVREVLTPTPWTILLFTVRR